MSRIFAVPSVQRVCEPSGSTLVLRRHEEVQEAWPRVPQREAEAGALSVQQGKSNSGMRQERGGCHFGLRTLIHLSSLKYLLSITTVRKRQIVNSESAPWDAHESGLLFLRGLVLHRWVQLEDQPPLKGSWQLKKKNRICIKNHFATILYST